MANKITHIKPKIKKQESIADIMGITEMLDDMNTFNCPLSDDYTHKKVSSVDDAYIESLLAVSLVLKKQRKEINKKIKQIKETLDKISGEKK